MRKKQHNLVDIIATIQENQNAIVDVSIYKNIIVQGCAGSGKTMVLLHRLSSLKYNHPEFNFDHALLLTPNQEFSLHIKGLAEGLQVGNIERVSVEQYYEDMLLLYSDEFKLTSKIVPEIFVKKGFVDYIYSDDFKVKFNTAFDKIVRQRNDLLLPLYGAYEAMGEPTRDISFEKNEEVIPQMERLLDHLKIIISNKTKEITDFEKAVKKIKDRKALFDEKIPKLREYAATIVNETVPKVYTKLGTLLSEIQYNIEGEKQKLQEQLAENERVQRSLNPFGKAAKLDELEKNIAKTQRNIETEESRLVELDSIFDNTMQEKADEEILAWMRRLTRFIPTIGDEIRLCERVKNELQDYLKENHGIDEMLLNAQMQYNAALQSDFSEDIKENIKRLSVLLGDYSTI
jgi:hypothetical protein